MLPQAAKAATEHSVSTPEDLTAALGGAASGDTVKLQRIRVCRRHCISGKTIIFDLNGKKLSVTNATGNGLDVGGGVVDVTDTVGGGRFDVTSSASSGYGVYAMTAGRGLNRYNRHDGDRGHCRRLCGRRRQPDR
jgi:hypothetical protein